jgi:hypothetical protein
MSAHAHTTLLRSPNPGESIVEPGSEQSFKSHFSCVTLGFGTGTGISTDSITWPASISLAAALSVLAFLYLRRSQPRTNPTQPPEKKNPKIMFSKPKDGAIRVAGIFVHPIKVRLFPLSDTVILGFHRLPFYCTRNGDLRVFGAVVLGDDHMAGEEHCIWGFEVWALGALFLL